jgi:hypothetical protein
MDFPQNFFLPNPKHEKLGVCGVKVSIGAFQALDPGSIPGKRILFFVHIFGNI